VEQERLARISERPWEFYFATKKIFDRGLSEWGDAAPPRSIPLFPRSIQRLSEKPQFGIRAEPNYRLTKRSLTRAVRQDRRKSVPADHFLSMQKHREKWTRLWRQSAMYLSIIGSEEAYPSAHVYSSYRLTRLHMLAIVSASPVRQWGQGSVS
jgi:phytoene dehydrogenase-like protein